MTARSMLDLVPIPVLFPLTVVFALVAVEAGRWLGQRRKESGTEPEASIGASVGATLGLLAFVLAFTFGMAADRSNTRREQVVEDANAIGTTYLRTYLLPDPPASEMRKQLREYVDVRVKAATNPETLLASLARSEELQGMLWRQAATIGTQQPNPATTGLFIEALNNMIDVHGTRVAAVNNRISGTIWFFAFLTTAVGMLSMGYQAGVSGSRRTVAVLGLTIAFAGVIMLIADLDRPQEGFLRVSQQSMIDLQRSMQADTN
jgi:uncharacterized membrane protein